MHRGPVHLEAELLGLHRDRGAARHLRDEEPRAVAHGLRRDVLVGVLGAGDRRYVQSRLVREGRRPDVRRLRVHRPVEHLGDVVADGGEPLEAPLGEAAHAEFQLEVGDHRREVGVAGALAEAVERALHVAGAREHRRHRVGHRATRVVVAVDADQRVAAHVGAHVGDDLAHLVGQRPAVGVAQHDVRRPRHHRGLEHAHGVLAVALPPVEEVLEVHQDPPTLTGQVPHRVVDHRDALVQRGLQRLAHVVVPTLGDDAHVLGAGGEQPCERRVLVHAAGGAARGAERDEPRRPEPQVRAGAREELVVLRVGPGPAALDEVHAEAVELLGDAQLVLHAGRDALDLHAVAQRRVEDLDELAPQRVSRRTHTNPCTCPPGPAPRAHTSTRSRA